MKPDVLVTGAGGALGGHLVKRLLDDGHRVRAVDIKLRGEWWQSHEGVVNWYGVDLSHWGEAIRAVSEVDLVYNLACDMGGIGWLVENRAAAMQSVLINTHLLRAAREAGVHRYWYASSACVYAAGAQTRPEDGYRLLKEEDAWPAQAEDGYGEEKLFSEQACRYARQDWGLETRIGRLHNVYGEHSTWDGGREKAPAALSRKVAQAKIRGEDHITVWGDGTATRSFLYVSDFVEGAIRVMESDYPEPVNIGSDEVVTVDELARMVMDAAGVSLEIRHDPSAPRGVAGRGSDNTQLRHVTGWEPQTKLRDGLDRLYRWVEAEVKRAEGSSSNR